MRVSNITKHKDGYEDILDERRRNGDLRWLLKTRDVPTYKYNHPRTPQQIREHVIQSDRVKYTVEQVRMTSLSSHVAGPDIIVLASRVSGHLLDIQNLKIIP